MGGESIKKLEGRVAFIEYLEALRKLSEIASEVASELASEVDINSPLGNLNESWVDYARNSLKHFPKPQMVLMDMQDATEVENMQKNQDGYKVPNPEVLV